MRSVVVQVLIRGGGVLREKEIMRNKEGSYKGEGNWRLSRKKKEGVEKEIVRIKE